MKIYIFIFAFLFIGLHCFPQNAMFTKGKGYRGYIFDKECFVFMDIDNQKERHTPTVEDIQEAEKILKDNTQTIKIQSRSRSSSLEKINFNNYIRQYVGFINNDGDIIIWINMIKNGSISANKFLEDIVMVLDGGNNYWSIFINITKKQFFGLSVNGIS